MKNLKCTVAIASDDNYVEHMCTLIVSILENRKNTSCEFTFAILDNNISDENKKRCKILLSSYKKAKITFLDVSSRIKKYQDSCHLHFTPDTFSRLYLPELLPSTDKVLYLDADTCACADITPLFNLDIESWNAGAVCDYIMNAFVRSKVRAPQHFNRMPAGAYIVRCLGLSIQPLHYFQAGVLLFNLKKIREEQTFEAAKKLSVKHRYWFVDQDILNIVLKNKIIFIDPKWNTVNVGDDILNSLSQQHREQLYKTQQDPYIIHYAGDRAKPWINKDSKLGEYYHRYNAIFHAHVDEYK